jgi:hypothetical protein
MTSIDRRKLKELMKGEERRFIAEHPKSAALCKRAEGSLLGGVPSCVPIRQADIDLHTKIFAEAAREMIG